MTKADGFRVLQEGGGEGSKGRLEAVWGLLDRHTRIAGCLPVRRPETLMDTLDVGADALDDESALDLFRLSEECEVCSHMVWRDFSAALEENENCTTE